MNIIEQATKRLEELRRGGVEVPWEASRLSETQFEQMLRSGDAEGLPRGGLPGAGPAAQRAAEAPAEASHAQSKSVALDLAMLERSGLLVPSLARSDLALEFRHIKRPLLRHAEEARTPGKQRQSLIMVTSALPGEGKTFCAINLAISIAMEVDTSVLLVDADVLRPSVFERLGLESDRGLLDLLTEDGLAMSDVLLKTNIPKLSLLPAGRSNPIATELLASDAMDRWLEEVATRYQDRVVIFDGPPLLLTAEARVLASRVGQVAVVVDASSTAMGKVSEAFAMIESCPLVMSVLNKCAPSERPGGYYGYGYR